MKIIALKRKKDEIEEQRATERGRILYMKRFEKHIMVQDYLNQALKDNAVMEELYDSMHEIAIDIKSGNIDLQFSGVKKICFLFKNLVDPPIAFVVENNIVPHMLTIISNNDQGHIFRHDAARLLRVILDSSPDQAKVIMDAGGIASYAALLTAQQDVLKYEAVVGVERAASLSSEYRNELLHLGVVTPLAAIVEQHLQLPLLELNRSPYYILNKGASALRSLCSGDPLPTPEEMENVVLILKRLINVDTGHSLAIRDACLALRFLSRGSAERMNNILDDQVCERLVFLLDPITPNAIIDPVLTFVRSIFGTSDPNVQLLVNSGMLPRLHEVLNGDDIFRPFWQKSCDVISVFLNAGRQRLQMVLDADLILPLLEITQDQFAPVETRLAAVCAIANAARIGSFPQIMIMVNQGCLVVICQHLNSMSDRTRYLCVEGLFNVLHMGSTNLVDGVNPFTALAGALGGFHRLMNIRNDARAGKRARLILLRYN